MKLRKRGDLCKTRGLRIEKKRKLLKDYSRGLIVLRMKRGH